ncbi:MAG: hypothetical protein IJJ70_09590 [Treponema sp.]|nr:hypothetical protein [Treponema sp.]
MKKYLNSITKIAVLACAALFCSCSGVIFDTIRTEVKLTDAQVSGDVFCITRHSGHDGSEYLYTSLGTIKRKDVTENSTATGLYGGQWKVVNKPSGLITGIISASDSYLYLTSLKIETVEDDGENEPKSYSIYYSDDDGETWNSVKLSDDTEISTLTYSGSIVKVFGTNSPKAANRAAFLNYAGLTYKLEAGVAKSISADSTYVNLGTSSQSVALLDGVYYFSDNYSMTSNETSDTDATCIYTGSSDSIKYLYTGTYDADADGYGWVSVDPDLGTIYSLSYAQDKILVGTSEGIKNIILNDTTDANLRKYEPSNSTGTFSSNAASALSSYYQVWQTLVLDPSENLEESDLYASMDFEDSSSNTSATFQNVGMWAFYPGRASWNRE